MHLGNCVQHERWTRLEHLFAQAMKQPASDRETWLSRACGDDAAMFREVSELLHADATPGMLDTFPFSGKATPATAIAGSLAAGTRVGGWQVQKLVGRGGMGEVYDATRVEAEF